MNYLLSLRFEPLLAFLCGKWLPLQPSNLLRRFKVSDLAKSFTILMNISPQNFKENAKVQSLSKRGCIYTIFLDFKFNTLSGYTSSFFGKKANEYSTCDVRWKDFLWYLMWTYKFDLIVLFSNQWSKYISDIQKIQMTRK